MARSLRSAGKNKLLFSKTHQQIHDATNGDNLSKNRTSGHANDTLNSPKEPMEEEFPEIKTPFPESAMEPKVQVPFNTAPGKVPRKIEIERIKRSYDKYSIEELLSEKGIEYNGFGQPPFKSFLPLEIFDNTDFDPRTPEEWIALGYDEDQFKYIPAIALKQTESEARWVDCQVVDYQTPSHKLKVKWVDDQVYEWIHRINVMFKAEDPINFSERVVAAHKEREQAESLIRYNLYIDSMPTDAGVTLDRDTYDSIVYCSTRGQRTKMNDMLERLMVSVAQEYSRTMNKIVFDMNLQDPRQKELFSNLKLPEEPQKTVPWLGVISIPEYNFEERFDSFNFKTFLNQREVIFALVEVKHETDTIFNQNALFTIPIKKTVGLDEFEQIQNQSLEKVKETFHKSWPNRVAISVRETLSSIGKGWLNVHEKKRELYEISKLKRFMTAVKFMMEDRLQYFLADHLEEFVTYIEKSTDYDISIKSISKIEATFRNREASLAKPLFRIEIIQKQENFCYNTDIDRFLAVIIQLFDKAITYFKDIPQVEPMVMNHFFWERESCTLNSIQEHEALSEHLRKRLQTALAKATVPLSDYLSTFDEFVSLVQLKPAEYAKKFAQENPHMEDLREKAQEYLELQEYIHSKIPANVQIGTFVVESAQIRNTLVKRAQELSKLILSQIARVAKSKASSVREKFQQISNRIERKNKTIEQLSEVKEFAKGVPDTIHELEAEIEETKIYYRALESFNFPLNDDEFRQQWQIYNWPNKIETQLQVMEKIHQKDEEQFWNELLDEQDEFEKEIEAKSRIINSFSKYSDISRASEIAAEVKSIQQQLKQLDKKAKTINFKEEKFGKPQTYYAKLHDITKDFEPYARLWLTTNDWVNNYNSWMNDPFTSLNPEIIQKEVDNANSIMLKSMRMFKEIPSLYNNVKQIKSEIDAFKPHLPLISALRNPGMKERHWNALSEKLNKRVVPGETFGNFSGVLELGLQDKKEEILKVCDLASKEYSIESSLQKMKAEWKDFKFEIVETKTPGNFVLRGSDEITQLLDDHIAKTQSMGFSPYKKYFEEDIGKWETTLSLVSEIIEAWMECQKKWLYLEPIFNSEDIMKQLPDETKKFKVVNHKWHQTMAMAKANPHVMEFCQTNSRLLQMFQKSNEDLDWIQKGLDDYLETKRRAFARFYFLSDDELLQILSHTRDPRAVQPHLKKCFENIYKLDFTENNEMTAMYSGEGEHVEFCKTVQTKGNVENWLLEVGDVMQLSVKDQIKRSLEDYIQTPREEWVTKWPGQVILVVSQIIWAKEVTERLCQGQALDDYYEELVLQLERLTQVVRKATGRLEKQTLEALITIDVHARDVIEKMAEQKVVSVDDFEWISQLRYYWEEEEVRVRQVEASFIYGYEYLGNTSRLVITPLTDRIYLTLTGAVHLHLGGAPAGPAGTGKTETVKDLAKALGKKCVVFNCQEGLDYLAMAKFFKGQVMSGAWACFDEFNRIDIEVLSVVAQQITTMQGALNSNLKTLDFEGTVLSVDPTFAIFITMNPGYAGRTELPDNLKALFRPVACMIPDYALIAEIRLFSFGFSNAKQLSQKMVATFRLSSEQLSSQDHYDFGMRAVNTVIAAAGLLKREQPDQDEELLLLQALRDSNLPKFLENDTTLFNGIISDLFPEVNLPEKDHLMLVQALDTAARSFGLQPVESFLNKCIQLFETTVLRHGVMLVGPTGSGKTSCYKVLAKAMTSLTGKGSKFDTVKISACNPKAVTMGQLYGEFEQYTHEWQDGIIAELFREAVADESSTKHWILFDGPVDALWIESMNTVLDDNKKLCLVSGEIITMSPRMTVMFEVEDLAVASPATVSRCGMVYLEPSTCVSVRELADSWLEGLDANFDFIQEKLRSLFGTFLYKCLDFVRKNSREYISTVDSNLVSSCFNLLDSLLKKFPLDSSGELSDHEQERLKDTSGSLFLFALIWSLGGSCDKESRSKFDEFLKLMVKENLSELGPVHLPQEGILHDYLFDIEKKDWIPWIETAPHFEIQPEVNFSSLLVPTTDTIRYQWLLELLVTNKKHVLCIGPTGTGKSLNTSQKLLHGMPKNIDALFFSFSAQTSANQLQDGLQNKFTKRLNRTYGAPAGKHFAIFIDDMNMPKREVYGAQPPIELLRQWMDYKGWYSKKGFLDIVDISFVAAMGPPGGGRNPVTNRFLRHFNFIAFPELDDVSTHHIFNTILGGFLKTKFDSSIASISSNIVEASIELYNTIRRELLPTPTKSHYTFNLRDLAAVFKGLLSAHPKTVSAANDLLRLWAHESARIFRDRLVDDTDREWFDKLIKHNMAKHHSCDWQDIITCERLIYADFLHPEADPPIYAQATDMNKLVKLMEEYLQTFNSESNKPMNLVMFLDAIEHVARISRIIRQPGGNALLLGIGGSGRQSLTRLAAHISEQELFQVEIAKDFGLAEWREFLKGMLLKAGVEEKELVFLFSDTQIVNEIFVEDINNILNSGDVTNLYDENDEEQIFNAMKPLLQRDGIAINKLSLYDRYLRNIKDNLHVVLAFSPVGEAFRNRLRMFPSLVNNCTIDWFSEWPSEALISVAKHKLIEEIEQSEDSEIWEAVIQMCEYVHQSVAEISRQYLQELRRHNHVTPTSYLELLSTFQVLLQEKRDELNHSKDRFSNGLSKLIAAANEVQQLESELKEEQPKLVKMTEDLKVMMTEIEEEKREAEETRKQVEQEEIGAQEKAEICEELHSAAKAELREAEPALNAALASLKELKHSDIAEVGGYKAPSNNVLIVLEAVNIMFEKKLKGFSKKDTVFTKAKKLLSDPRGLLDDMVDYDRNNIPEKTISKVSKFMDMEEFQPKKVEDVSKALTAMCKWVRAMFKYHHVNKSVQPLREKLEKTENDLQEVNERLAETKRKLQEVQNKIESLEQAYKDSNEKKEQVSQRVEDIAEKLDRAQRLTSGLGGEKSRWEESIKQLEADEKDLVGNVLLAASGIAYCGAFTASFRLILVKKWKEEMERLMIPFSRSGTMLSILKDPVRIRSWTLQGLPTDQLSIENAIIMSKSRRWPLMIDPQGQASKWIKNLEKDNNLKVLKPSTPNLLRTLENAIQFGTPVLLENVSEELDPAIEPLLAKQTYFVGGSEVIKLGEAVIPYNSNFRFYMSTKLRNPKYSPETAVKVTLLNFFITPGGLEDQLLGVVVARERPDLQEMKNQLVISNAQMRSELEEIEAEILSLLEKATNILEDEALIETLSKSKQASTEIKEKVEKAELTEKEIDITRNEYRPVAKRGSNLFFCVSDMAAVDPMYQYSLQWFLNLFDQGIENAEQSEVLTERLNNLQEFFTYSLYKNVCRSLFETHKLLFSFIMTIKILKEERDEIDPQEWRFFITGSTSSDRTAKPPASWLNTQSWFDILDLAKLPDFKGFDEDFISHLDEFEKIFESPSPHKEVLPGKWNSLTPFQKLIFVRCLRPDKASEAIQEFITHNVGDKFIEPPTFELMSAYQDSSETIPLLFILSPGADPATDLTKFATNMGKQLSSISLGQGQGGNAAREISLAASNGAWVLLQNCHLAVSWMPELEKIIENFEPEHIQSGFRLWLTSMPSKEFPVSVLQNSVKMTNEPPKGLKPNLLRSFSTLSDDFLQDARNPRAFQKLLFGLCFFHAIIQERRKFGPLGWNIPYEFTTGDLNVCIRQLHLFINKYENIPFKVLEFLTGEINYGGRVTDNWDRRTMMTIIKSYVTKRILEKDFKFSESGIFYAPEAENVSQHIAYIKSLPINPSPEVFGLHDNADITYARTETFSMLETIMLMQPRSSAGGEKSREDIIEEMAGDIQNKIRSPFDIDAFVAKYPTDYNDSMNTVLTQEAVRYNKLIEVIHESLTGLRKALKGLVVMSEQLEELGASLFMNQVPNLWASKAYPSLKPLSSWVQDLERRLTFIEEWYNTGTPKVFWISGFSFPQAFLTGTLQNYARANHVSIDSISFGFQVLKQPEEELPSTPPGGGCYIKGLYLEGAKWDPESQCLSESNPRELFVEMPIIWLKPEINRTKPTQGVYNCPTYKTTRRAGTLSTTGHSTNYILAIELPIKEDEEHWIRRGVAMVCALNY